MRTNIGAPTWSPSSPSAASASSGASTRTRPRAEVSRNASRTVREEVFSEPARFVPGVELLAQRDERAGNVFVGHRPQDREPAVERAPAEQRANALDVDRAVGDGLVQERQRVAHRPRAGAGDDGQGIGIGADPLLRTHVGEVRGDLVDGVQRELEVLGARADGGRDLQRIGGGEHEHDVLRRFLERLQQRGFPRFR